MRHTCRDHSRYGKLLADKATRIRGPIQESLYFQRSVLRDQDRRAGGDRRA
jgi:hypothetical protein